MFERYIEKCRRVIFFSRYEASQFGSPYIETQHILLGLLREDKALVSRLSRLSLSAESIRKQIDSATMIRERVSTSVDLPLSNESKRVLAYAAEEAELLGHKHIGTEHLLLGLLREDQSFAAKLLRESGISLEVVREEIKKGPPATSSSIVGLGGGFGFGHPAPMIEFVEDGKPLTISAVILVLPRAGEEVVLGLSDGPRTYRVENVRFVLVSDPHFKSRDGQRLEKIQVLVKQIPS
jgi:ATP-dependent Clp protease ATP-binding subunit ClpC